MQSHKIFYFVVVATRLVLPFPACFVRMQTRIQIPGGVRGRAKVRFFIITSARDKKESLLWHTRFLTHVLAAALARALALLVLSPLRMVLQL